ncbi:MAG: cytochrome b/b6 domain-containing protein [Hydrogenophilaceae bacterium]|nr:cytochrome b/b6 domain-containing protein [Hydrogenophilaceae bacterium]
MAANRIKVWDPAVRLFHWALVVLFAVAYLSGEESEALHAYAGYGVLGLIGFRLVWGFLGTKHARFSDFLYGPTATLRYARALMAGKPIHYLGHNPIGGWMIVLLLLSLFGACWSGLKLYAIEEGKGPLARVPAIIAPAKADEAGGADEAGEEFWEEVHEVLSNLTLALVFIHIAGVVVASRLHRENLARAMVTGYKEKQD